MSIGFPAYHEETRRFGSSQAQLFQAIQAALKTLNWKYETDAGADFLARVRSSASSFGERVQINLHPNSQVRARSECVWPFQLVDYGKNRRNVQRLFAKVEAILSPRNRRQDDSPPQFKP